MSTSEHRLFPARLAMLPEAAAFTQAFCTRHGVVHDDAMRLTLIVEELFTNTVEHGYRGESDVPIRIELTLTGGGVSVVYEDEAPRYDPLARLADASAGVRRPVDSRPVGGLGVYLVSQLV